MYQKARCLSIAVALLELFCSYKCNRPQLRCCQTMHIGRVYPRGVTGVLWSCRNTGGVGALVGIPVEPSEHHESVDEALKVLDGAQALPPGPAAQGSEAGAHFRGHFTKPARHQLAPGSSPQPLFPFLMPGMSG